MVNNLKCKVCKKRFDGNGNRLYCSKDCKLEDRRKNKKKIKDNKKTKEEKNRESSKKYYLKHKYPLTKKYEKEQKETIKKRREDDNKWRKNNKKKVAESGRKAKKKIREWFEEYKKTLECEFCGYNRCPGALEFHHKNKEDKEFNIGNGIGRIGKEIILKEIEKCIVLCVNCHRELHYKERQKINEKEHKRKRQEYLKMISEEEKKVSLYYYKIVEKEFETDWFKELQDKAKYNLNKFGGNQYSTKDNRVKEKIDIKTILSEKIGIPTMSISRIIQIYKRGTEDQKRRAREGIDSLNKIYKELKPIRYSKNFETEYKENKNV